MKRKIVCIFCLIMVLGVSFLGCGSEPDPMDMPSAHYYDEPDPMDIPSDPTLSGSITNGPLTETAWVSFAYHVYSGPNIGDGEMDGSDSIVINKDTTTLKGGFWTGIEGTYPSYYSEINPDYVISTAPSIYVFISNTDYIEIIQGSHGGRDPDETSYGVIMWVSTSLTNEWGGHDRADVYFRSVDYQTTVSNNKPNDKPTVEGGTVTSLAGTSTAGYADGVGTAARFSAPEGIAVDNSGNIYVAVFEYIEAYYNRRRRHSAIGYAIPIALTPDMVA